MHHFFTDPRFVRDGRVLLRGDEAHHAVKVLRVRVGETISVADGTGRVLDTVVTRTTDETLEGRVILTREARAPRPVLVLCQGIARKERMDLVVQKAVELGAREVVPFVAERTIVRWDEAKRAKATERWSAIALSAAKQCRSPWPTAVAPVAAGVGSLPDAAPMLVLHEKAAGSFRAALPAEAPDRLLIVVGPEGGLSEAEVDELEQRGARPVTLGERILRTETAGPVALALASYSFGTLG